MECKVCEGRGKIWEEGQEDNCVCPWCHYSTVEPTVKCPQCNGSGETPDVRDDIKQCPKCNGGRWRIVIDKEYDDSSSRSDKCHYEECDICNGYGFVVPYNVGGDK